MPGTILTTDRYVRYATTLKKKIKNDGPDNNLAAKKNQKILQRVTKLNIFVMRCEIVKLNDYSRLN